MTARLRYTFLGLSITSSWGNGHATTYRALLRALAERGHEVTFLERDLDFYAANRDMPEPPFAKTILYRSLDELRDRHASAVREADLVVVGSYVPDGIEVGAWAQSLAPSRTAFYDIDTPVTLAALERGECTYLTPELVSRYALYLSFTGGPTLARIERQYGSPCARALYCSVDPAGYFPEETPLRWDLGYLGTYSADRQPTVERLLLEVARKEPARSFAVAGAQYPADVAWPANVWHDIHLAPSLHRGFYCAQRWTLNVTRAAMIRAGWSPSVRLFEAGACGTPIISDRWPGLEDVLVPGREILVAETTADVQRILREVGEDERRAIAARARSRILGEHTAMHRAETLERLTREVLDKNARRVRPADRSVRTEIL